MKYSIIIPTYNHCDDYLKPCIESILKNTDLDNTEIIISANGCTDNTGTYLYQLKEIIADRLKVIWCNNPLGFAKANNEAIKVAKGEFVVLLNNDCVVLDYWEKGKWLYALEEPFILSDRVGITGTHLLYSEQTKKEFLLFYCVMIKRGLFDVIGLLDEDFGVGGGEDMEFCWRTMKNGYEVKSIMNNIFMPDDKMYVSEYPLWHKAEGTVHDQNLVKDWDKSFAKNMNLLMSKVTKKPKFSIIIPTYNHLEDCLKPCIDSVLQYTDLDDVEIIISANGCTDGTAGYLAELQHYFSSIGYGDHLISLWSDDPIGYSRANNAALEVARGDYLILINNDIVLLHQEKNTWVNLLENPFKVDRNCGLSGVILGYSDPADAMFLVFFCVMISRECFEAVGYLDTAFGVGGGEDTDYCIRAVEKGFNLGEAGEKIWSKEAGMYTGVFPIYHKGEATVHDPNCVPDWQTIFTENSQRLTDMYKKTDLTKIRDSHPSVYDEVIGSNVYGISEEMIRGNTVIDIGANVGMFSIFAASLGASNVIAFEPVHNTYNTFVENIKKARVKNVYPFNNAITDKTGDIVEISVCADSGHNSIYNVNVDKGQNILGTEKVETIGFLDMMKSIFDDNIVLKMDCEGAEYDILMPLSKNDMEKVKYILIEIHGSWHPKYPTCEILEEKLIELGYKMLDVKQIYFWTLDENGEKQNVTPAPIKIQQWERI